MLRHHLTQMDCGSCSIGYPCKDLSGKTKSIELINIRVSVRGAFLHSISLSAIYLADKEQQVSVAGEVHGEKEEGQLLHHRYATLVGQRKGQRFDFWSFFGRRRLGVQCGARPFGRPPQTDQVFKVLQRADIMALGWTSSSLFE